MALRPKRTQEELTAILETFRASMQREHGVTPGYDEINETLYDIECEAIEAQVRSVFETLRPDELQDLRAYIRSKQQVDVKEALVSVAKPKGRRSGTKDTQP